MCFIFYVQLQNYIIFSKIRYDITMLTIANFNFDLQFLMKISPSKMTHILPY